MKLFFVLAVATSSLVLLVQGAPSPQIRSEELGKTMEQLREFIHRELLEAQAAEANAQQWPQAQQGYYDQQRSQVQQGYYDQQRSQAQYLPYYQQRPQAQQRPQKFGSIQQHERVTAEVNGVDIRNCGAAGAITNSALSILNIFFAGQFGVLVDCQISPGCVQVRVDVPASDPVTDIDVCDLGNGQACVQVYVEPTQACTGGFPITIPIPLPNGQQIFIQIVIDTANNCATVRVNAPQCPPTNGK